MNQSKKNKLILVINRKKTSLQRLHSAFIKGKISPKETIVCLKKFILNYKRELPEISKVASYHFDQLN